MGDKQLQRYYTRLIFSLLGGTQEEKVTGKNLKIAMQSGFQAGKPIPQQWGPKPYATLEIGVGIENGYIFRNGNGLSETRPNAIPNKDVRK